MSLRKYYLRLKRVDYLIQKKSAGDPASLAKKIGLSKSGTEKLIREMKELKFPIAFCRKRKIYYYTQEGKMADTLFEKEISNEEMKKIKGGKTISHFFLHHNYSTLYDDNFTL